ncbi:MAG: Maf family protein [Pseudomonadota bacterium]|nr:Maf family protein [Pseudomonadota bacterium]
MPEAGRRIVLASASPRRRDLLHQIGIACDVRPPHVDESLQDGESAETYVRRLALDKARATAGDGVLPVLGADTAVILGGSILGKPTGRRHALEMLASLSGREHTVLTAVALVKGGWHRVALSSSRVSFRETSREEREWYWSTGECRDKAGAYGIQGLGALFVRQMSGSFSGVAGLPLFETGRLLTEAGLAHWNAPGEPAASA